MITVVLEYRKRYSNNNILYILWVLSNTIEVVNWNLIRLLWNIKAFVHSLIGNLNGVQFVLEENK